MATQAEIQAALKSLKPAERRAVVAQAYDTATPDEQAQMVLRASLALPVRSPTDRRVKSR